MVSYCKVWCQLHTHGLKLWEQEHKTYQPFSTMLANHYTQQISGKCNPYTNLGFLKNGNLEFSRCRSFFCVISVVWSCLSLCSSPTASPAPPSPPPSRPTPRLNGCYPSIPCLQFLSLQLNECCSLPPSWSSLLNKSCSPSPSESSPPTSVRCSAVYTSN